MKIDKATPGPWVHGLPTPYGTFHANTIYDADGEAVAQVYGIPINTNIESVNISRWGTGLANAQVISAAPDLLVACQTFAEWLRREEAGGTNEPWAGRRDTPEGEAAWREWYYENLRICDLAQKQARAAIAKATGEAP